MKEQWKKLDSDAKLLLNVEEGRAVPIKIELPISAFASSQPNCCKGLITTLRISVLFLSLLLLGWTAKTLYSNYFYDGEIGEFVHSEPLFNSDENKQIFRQKVYAYDSQKNDVNDHESNDVGSSESNIIKVRDGSVSWNEDTYSLTSESHAYAETSTQSKIESGTNDPEEEKELKNEKQSEVETVSENNNVDEEKKVEEETYDKPVRTFYHQIDSIAMDDDETDENIIDQFLHKISQLQNDNSIENDRQWKDVSEAEREIEELEKQAQKELEDEVNKVLGELFENAAMAVLDELTHDESKSDNSKSTNDSNEEKVEVADHDILINTDESLEEEKDLVKWLESIIEDEPSKPFIGTPSPSETETESEPAVTLSSETNSEEAINRGFGEMSTEEANNDKSITDKQSSNSDEIESPENTFATPAVEQVVMRKVEREDIMAIVAKRLEPIVGQNYELLLWYLANKDKPIFEIANDPLKVNTAKMLYSNNVREYGKDSAAVVDLIADEAYEKEFEKMMNPAYEKIQPETEVQREIVFRLQEKSNIFRKLNEEPSSFEESLFTELIDAYNAIDEVSAQRTMEEINDRTEEEESTDETINYHSLLNENKNYIVATTESQIPINDNEKDSSMQSLLQAMRNVGTFQDMSELMKFQDTMYQDRQIDRIPEKKLYFSDEDVLGTYDTLLAQRLEPMFDPIKSEQNLYNILQKIVEDSEIENNNSDEVREEQDTQDIQEPLVEDLKDVNEKENSFHNLEDLRRITEDEELVSNRSEAVQEEQDNQDIQESLEETSKDADDEEKSFQVERQDEANSDATVEMTTGASQKSIDKYYRAILDAMKSELVPEGMYESDDDFYASVIPILHRKGENRPSVLHIVEIIDAIEESNNLRRALSKKDQEYSVSWENQEVQNSEEVQSNQSNQEEAEIQRDQSKQEEAEIQPDQSNQDEAEIQPDQSNQEEAEIQPIQSNSEEHEIQPDQSNQEDTEIQSDQSNSEEPEGLQDQSNQEETEEQPSMNEFLTLFHDEYDGDY